ncbi:M13 family metallopeptidase [Gluconacetobacter liquefaciens]|uniref:M13 family metallopeptidase n=2 Tax=Gluconacetobacter liquefaciens TaxID=89584 RepID=A0A7W4JKY4_GLULI|nr:M13 family metallopeptidase [Gluconacetobacter liquefaciens]
MMLLGTACLAGVLAGTQAQAAATMTAPATPSVPAMAQGPWGFDLPGRNLSVKPGDNFFDYANGTYVDHLVIPPDRTSWGPFNELAELSRTRVQAILKDVSSRPEANPATIEGKLGTFYASFMDEAAVEALGAKPLAADLAAIRAVHDAASFAALAAKAQETFQSSPFSLMIQPDAKDPTRYALDLDQAGLGMPDRDYYSKPSFAAKKTAYLAYVEQMLGLIGWPDAKQAASDIVALETAIAKVHWARDEMRDPEKSYNPRTVQQLQKDAPGFDWPTWLKAAGLPEAGLAQRVLIAGEPSAIAGEAKILGATNIATLRAWMAFHLADNAAPDLSKPFVDAWFAFNGKTLSGQPQLPVRWKRAVGATSSAMGWAIGRVYVARYFPPESKVEMGHLTDALKTAFHVRLEHNSWMGPATRAAALRKLDNFTIQIGYPTKWRDYGTLEVHKGDVYGNATRAIAFEWQYWLGHLGKPVDRDEWDMTPQTVNAYNMPVFDEIVFPAAILQPPFFNPKADAAINYGAIGGVIGHEMTHSFDDEGRKFDEHGRLRDWWTKADATRFQKLADRLGAQYDAFEVLPGVHVNGKLTMGENIADLGGLTLALDAYHASLQGKPAPVIDGLTGDQRVFLGWAQVWREKVRDDAVRQEIVVDPHSPPVARVNIPMHNIDAWYAAWAVEAGQKLYLKPQDRVKIW